MAPPGESHVSPAALAGASVPFSDEHTLCVLLIKELLLGRINSLMNMRPLESQNEINTRAVRFASLLQNEKDHSPPIVLG